MISEGVIAMTEGEKLQDELDELRGELDKRNNQAAGWSGPITGAYMRGFGPDYDLSNKRLARVCIELRTEHGWYT